jgi:RNA polymerase sigma-70 factor (ECF subfamily)
MTAAPSAEFINQVTRSQRHLHAFIQTMIWHPTDADDVLQETNLVLWRKVDDFDPTRPFMPWAMRIAQLQAMAWLKTRSRAKQRMADVLLETLAAESIEEADEMEPRRVALADCLLHLSPEHRELIARRYEPDGCVNDVAEERGSTPKAVSEMLRRIRHNLMVCIDQKVRVSGS